MRRDGIDILKKLLKEHAISEDDEKRQEAEVQKATDQTIKEIDASLAAQGKGDHAGLGEAPSSEALMHASPSTSRSARAPTRRRLTSASSWTATAVGLKARGLPRFEGHRRGVEAVRRAVRSAIERGVQFLTIYSFSSENWSRPPDEVAMLMGLLKRFIRKDLAELNANGVRVRVIGQRDNLAPDIARADRRG